MFAPHAALSALHLVGQRLGGIGVGLGVGHFEQAGDAAEHRGAAARFEVFLVLQPRLAEMAPGVDRSGRSEAHTSELQSILRTSSARFCFYTKHTTNTYKIQT